MNTRYGCLAPERWKLGIASLLFVPIVFLPNPLGVILLMGVGIIALWYLRSNRGIPSSLLIVLVSISWIYTVPDAGAVETVPDYASPKEYGGGWVCDTGYRKVDEECQEISIPENAYATDSRWGEGWECKRGHVKSLASVFPFLCHPTRISLALVGNAIEDSDALVNHAHRLSCQSIAT